MYHKITVDPEDGWEEDEGIDFDKFIRKYREMESSLTSTNCLTLHTSHSLTQKTCLRYHEQTKLEEFMKNPFVKEAYKTGGLAEVARKALMAGNLSRDPELRKLAEDLTQQALRQSKA